MFNSKTLSKLNRFSHAIAKQIEHGLKHGFIGKSTNGDCKAEVREFLRKYSKELSRDHHINVSNILKTSKQLKFVVGSIAYKLHDVA